MFDFDWTILAVAAVFLTTLFAMNRLLFGPLLSTLERRKADTEGLALETEEVMSQYLSLFEKYQAAVKTEMQTGYRLAESRRAEAVRERQLIIAKARKKAEISLIEAREKVSRELESAKQQIRREGEALAALIASRVLGRA